MMIYDKAAKLRNVKDVLNYSKNEFIQVRNELEAKSTELKRIIQDLETKLNHPINFKGSVSTVEMLPSAPEIGDMYNIEQKSIYGEAGMNVAWNGSSWDTMGATIDISLYIKSSELADWAKQPEKPTYTYEEVGALSKDTEILVIDNTFSNSGQAADAKATGDKISALKTELEQYVNETLGVIENGSY